MIHSPAVSTPTTQSLGLQSNDHFSWNPIPTSSRDSEPRAFQKDNSPSLTSASLTAPFSSSSPDKVPQNTSPIPRQSSLTPPPSSPRRDAEADLSVTVPPISQDASPDPPSMPQQGPAVENPPPSRPLTPLSELSPVPDNDEEAPSDPPGMDKGEGSSHQPTVSSPSRQISVKLEATSSHTRISPTRFHPIATDQPPQRSSFSAPSGTTPISKAALILELNAELLKCDLPIPIFHDMTHHLAEYAWSFRLGPSPSMTRDITSLSIRCSRPLDKADLRVTGTLADYSPTSHGSQLPPTRITPKTDTHSLICNLLHQ
jgi:hypothetical protein